MILRPEGFVLDKIKCSRSNVPDTEAAPVPGAGWGGGRLGRIGGEIGEDLGIAPGSSVSSFFMNFKHVNEQNE